MDTFHSVRIDGKYLGEVQVSYETDPDARHKQNLVFALWAVDEMMPAYNPRQRIHELSIYVEMPRERRVERIVAAIATAMKLDALFETELLEAYKARSRDTYPGVAQR